MKKSGKIMAAPETKMTNFPRFPVKYGKRGKSGTFSRKKFLKMAKRFCEGFSRHAARSARRSTRPRACP